MDFPYIESIELTLKCQNTGLLQPLTIALVIWVFYVTAIMMISVWYETLKNIQK